LHSSGGGGLAFVCWWGPCIGPISVPMAGLVPSHPLASFRWRVHCSGQAAQAGRPAGPQAAAGRGSYPAAAGDAPAGSSQRPGPAAG
jgi:hypothetical protein